MKDMTKHASFPRSRMSRRDPRRAGTASQKPQERQESYMKLHRNRGNKIGVWQFMLTFAEACSQGPSGQARIERIKQ